MELSNETLLALVHFCPSFIPLLRQISSPRRNSWRNKALPALLRRYLLSFDYATRQRIPSSFLCRPQDPPPLQGTSDAEERYVCLLSRLDSRFICGAAVVADTKV